MTLRRSPSRALRSASAGRICVGRIVKELYVEKDGERRELYRKLMMWEERWYGENDERLEAIQRLLRDCDGRVAQLRLVFDRERALGVGMQESEYLLENLLQLQRILQDSFRDELSHRERLYSRRIGGLICINARDRGADMVISGAKPLPRAAN